MLGALTCLSHISFRPTLAFTNDIRMTKSIYNWFRGLLPLLVLALGPAAVLTSCEDNVGNEDNSEFTDHWKERNAQYFLDRMNEAKAAIREAKAAYGDDWEAHTDWRTVRSTAKVNGTNITVTDSICFKYVEHGTSIETPLYTDSVRTNYIGRLIPTASYANGRIFDHSGLYDDEDRVFNSDFSTPTAFAVSNMVEGYTTLLQYLHVGDRVRAYLPQELAYLGASNSMMPSYSTLIFDVQLKGIWRAGTKVGTWE